MTPDDTKQKEKSRRGLPLLFALKRNGGLPLLFLLLVLFPVANMTLRIVEPVPIRENRRLAPKPAFQAGRPLDFLRASEAYFNDHFGLRTQLVRAHSLLLLKLLGTSSTPKVIIGHRGWLYLARGGDFNNEIDYFRAVTPFSERELEEYKNVLEERRDWLARRGIRYVFMLAPNKSTIYPEFVPRALNKVHPLSRMDQLVDYLSRHSSLRLLDLRPALRREKRRARIYHKTDSHWNDLGGFFASRELIGHLGRYFPAVRPPALADFTVGEKNTPGGDLATLLFLQRDVFRETRITVRPKSPPRARQAAPTPGFRPGARWVRIQATECRGAPIPVAVMVRDSYVQQMHPFLSENFGRIVYIWDWSLRFFTEVIEAEKPQVVIDQMVERALLNPIPVNPDEVRRECRRLNPR